MIGVTASECKVADIQFSYKNHALIEALRKRGYSIAQNKFDDMRTQEEEINTLISNEFERLTTPTCAFITFENDDCQLAATQLETNATLLGQEMKFEKASEPTDIIWENRRFTPTQYLQREVFAYVLLGILLAGSVAVVYSISAASKKIADVYPTVQCSDIYTSYGDDLQIYAVQDFDALN